MPSNSRAATLQVLVLNANLLFANVHMKFALCSVRRAVLSPLAMCYRVLCVL